jgi:hypothetical protein
MDELIADYASGALHPADVKPALAKAINAILQVLFFLQCYLSEAINLCTLLAWPIFCLFFLFIPLLHVS